MVWTNEYMHTDEVGDLLYAKDQEIKELQDAILHFERRIRHLQTELKRVETEYARGL
jgi:hypothetical protein